MPDGLGIACVNCTLVSSVVEKRHRTAQRAVERVELDTQFAALGFFGQILHEILARGRLRCCRDPCRSVEATGFAAGSIDAIDQRAARRGVIEGNTRIQPGEFYLGSAGDTGRCTENRQQVGFTGTENRCTARPARNLRLGFFGIAQFGRCREIVAEVIFHKSEHRLVDDRVIFRIIETDPEACGTAGISYVLRPEGLPEIIAAYENAERRICRAGQTGPPGLISVLVVAVCNWQIWVR